MYQRMTCFLITYFNIKFDSNLVEWKIGKNALFHSRKLATAWPDIFIGSANFLKQFKLIQTHDRREGMKRTRSEKNQEWKDKFKNGVKSILKCSWMDGIDDISSINLLLVTEFCLLMQNL